MNKNYNIHFILTIIFFLVCERCKSQDVLFTPKETRKYHFGLYSGTVLLDYNITCHYYDRDSAILMTSIVDKITYGGSSELNKEINKDYQKYVGDSLLTFFDKYGHAAENNADKLSRFINTEFFVLELPGPALKEGYSWTGKKSAKPDLLFDYIATKYTCKKITDSTITIYVEMSCKRKDNTNTYLRSLTKFYKGYYVIDRDGVVKNADLTLSGFTGLSNLNGKVKIDELP